MSAAHRPTLALSALPSPAPPGSLQFFDGFYPALDAGHYTMVLTHTLSGNAGVPAPFQVSQDIVVQGPEFTIDVTQVASVYPPAGGSDVYAAKLPFLVLSDPSLPWERSLTPASGLPSPAQPTPWMALLVFAESEIVFPPGASDPTVTCTVAKLLEKDTGVLKPTLPEGWVSADLLSSQCQTITVTGEAFNAVAPALADLPYLAHVRGVSTITEGEVLSSVFLANRLPEPAANPAAAVRYFAHLVSLEGFAAYLGTHALPQKPLSAGLVDVQLVSLYHWAFTSLADPGLSFQSLVAGLIASQQASGAQSPVPTLQLPVTPVTTSPTPAQTAVQNRLNEGFVPLGFVSGAQEDTFAWYRGPLTALVPQPIAAVGNPNVPVAEAASADALMVYLADQGLFDLSYAAAWNLGRNLALADGVFSQAILALRRAAASSVASLAQRRAMPHFSGIGEPGSLLTRNATRDRFIQLMAQGLGERWTGALAAVRSGPPRAAARQTRARRRFSRVAAPQGRALLADPAIVSAVSQDLAETAETVAAWLAQLASLVTVPFSSLVPDPRMLPVESIRFFYVDPAWLDALHAGAMSLALHGSSSHTLLNRALLPSIRAAMATHRRATRKRAVAHAALASTQAGQANTSGVLIRSQLVPGWPAMTVSGTLGGAPLNVLRDDCLSDTVRLVLFEGIPDTVTLAEPYQGVLFGVEDQGIYPRCVTASAFTGSPIANAAPVAPVLRTPASGGLGGVLDVAGTAAALTRAVGLTDFATGAVVKWNGTALNTTRVSARELTATVPASLVTAAGQASITVSSGTGTSLAASFTVNNALAIDTTQPAMVQAGGAGFTLNVAGVGFGPAAVVQWNGAALTTTVISANQLTATVDASRIADAGVATVTVLSGGASSNAVPCSIVTADATLTSLIPSVAAAGGAGFTLVVEGSGFAPGAVVQWNGNMLQTAYESDQQLRAAVPSALLAAVATAQVAVALEGITSNALPFTIAAAKPTLGSIHPSFALAGDGGFDLTLDGVNLGSTATVTWNSTVLKPASSSADQLIVAVPASLVAAAGISSVSVSAGGVSSNQLSFLTLGSQTAIALLQPFEVFAGSSQFTLTVYGGFGAGDFALQMVAAPQLQHFPNP